MDDPLLIIPFVPFQMYGLLHCSLIITALPYVSPVAVSLEDEQFTFLSLR